MLDPHHDFLKLQKLLLEVVQRVNPGHLVTPPPEVAPENESNETDKSMLSDDERYFRIERPSTFERASFKWRGASRVTGKPNYVELDRQEHQLRWFVAEFINKDQTYWKHPCYTVIMLKRDGTPLGGEMCLEGMAVPDGDFGSYPSIRDDLSRPRNVDPSAWSFTLAPRWVFSSYFENSEGSCADNM